MKTIKDSKLFQIITFVLLFFTSCEFFLEDDPTDPIENNEIAYLIQPDLDFKANESTKLIWLKMPAPGFVFFSNSNLFNVNVSKVGESDSTINNIYIHEHFMDILNLGAIEFESPEYDYFIEFERIENLSEPLSIEMQIEYFYPQDVFTEENFETNMIFSPVISYPEGNHILNLGDGEPAFTNYVLQEYNYQLSTGISYLQYMMLSELPLVFFPAATMPVMVEIPGPTPPDGAEHDDNYCGISAFVHSMLTTFPGALPADVTTNKDAWDKIGDAIDHSNTFGERGAKLVSEVNENFGESTDNVINGKKYCAAKLKDNITSAELAAKMDSCDVKLLIYDWPEFGHWVDVTAIDGDSLTIQDYGQSAKVKYDASEESVDFTSGQNTTMGSNFTGGDKVAGDDPFEIVIFVAVCECK